MSHVGRDRASQGSGISPLATRRRAAAVYSRGCRWRKLPDHCLLSHRYLYLYTKYLGRYQAQIWCAVRICQDGVFHDFRGRPERCDIYFLFAYRDVFRVHVGATPDIRHIAAVERVKE